MSSACCGHGAKGGEGYIDFENGVCIRFKSSGFTVERTEPGKAYREKE